MTVVSNDPSVWPAIEWSISCSYFIVASSVVVVYDWALTFGKEVDLLWRQRWSIMTLLCLSVRYTGILCSVNNILMGIPMISLTDIGCMVGFQTQWWASFIIGFMLNVIMAIRLHAMYQRSTKMFVFLIVGILAVNITCGVIGIMISSRVSGEVYILSGTYQCSYGGYEPFLTSVTWILGAVWEVLALCLAAWIAVKHLRELPRRPAGSVIEDCFTVLLKSHIFYFAVFAVVACLNISCVLFPMFLNSATFTGLSQIASFVQMFVVGPRLILSVREYHTELVVNSDVGTNMTAIAFQAGQVSSANDGDV